MQAAIEMVAKVKETLSKSAALKSENNNEEKDHLLITAKVEKLKKVRIISCYLMKGHCVKEISIDSGRVRG